MDIYKLKTLPEVDRQLVLSSEAIEVEKGTYMRPLSDEELREYKDSLAKTSIDQAVLLDELAEIKKGFKLKLDPLRSEISFCIDAIKNQSIQVTGDQYKLPDYENQMIHIVDQAGTVILSRPMYPKERQLKFANFPPLKASNGDE
jgi:hypothetical protein